MPILNINSPYQIIENNINNKEKLYGVKNTSNEDLDIDIFYPEITNIDISKISDKDNSKSTGDSNSSNENNSKSTDKNDINVTFDNLTKKHFDGDNKDYMVGKGTITFKTNCKKYDLEFITGSFASVDNDAETGKYDNDYIEININNKSARLEVPNTSKKYDVKSNNTGYKIDLEEIKKYDINLAGQSDRFNYTKIYKIKIYDLDTNEIKVSFHNDEDFSNEAIGYQIDSEKINCKDNEINFKTDKINTKKFDCNLEKVLHIIISETDVNVKGL